METLVVLGGDPIAGAGLPLDACHHLGGQDQIDDQGRGKERVLTDIQDPVDVSLVVVPRIGLVP